MKHKMPDGYEQKFEHFIKLCNQSQKNGIQQIAIAQPWALGDTYDEVIESLSRLAASNLTLHISEQAE